MKQARKQAEKCLERLGKTCFNTNKKTKTKTRPSKNQSQETQQLIKQKVFARALS